MGSRTYIALLGAAAVVILLQSWSLSSHVHHLNKPERPAPVAAAPPPRPPPAEAPRPAAAAADNSNLFASLRSDDAAAAPRSPPPPPPPPAPPAEAPVPRADAPLFRANAPRDEAETCATGVVALTYASHRGKDERFCRSVESAVRNGVDLRVLGWGVKWEGLSQKLAAALAAVDALPADCVVLFTDAYDVLFAASGAKMRRDFLALDQPLVFAGECGCWPQVQRDRGKTCRDLYPKSPTPYRYLNSGAWMGRAGVAARFLRRLVDTAGAEGAAFHKLNDQELAAELYFSGEFGPELGLDHYARLFQCMHGVRDTTLVPDCDPWPDLKERDGTLTNTRTESVPAVYHFNGGGKRHHLKVEAMMWWKTCSEAQSPEARAAVEATTLRFHESTVAFADVCPRHLADYAPKSTKPCGDALLRGLVA